MFFACPLGEGTWLTAYIELFEQSAERSQTYVSAVFRSSIEPVFCPALSRLRPAS